MIRKQITYVLFTITLVTLLMQGPILGASKEGTLFKRIKDLSRSGKSGRVVRLSNNFFKRYPKSRHIADIRLILAENEANPSKAIYKYRVLVDKFRFFNRRDYVQYRICEIYYLLSRWNELSRESLKGINLFKKSAYLTKFKFFLSKANIHQEKFYKARALCNDIIKTDHNYSNLSEALLLISYTNRNIYGYSRKYISGLKEIVIGFKNSELVPSGIYLLGRYYERKRDYDRSYSAYSDLLKRFPRAPESIFARKRLQRIKKYKPRLINYIPDKKIIESSDSIDIHPEIELNNNEYTARDIRYSISLGPFFNLRNAMEIKKLIKSAFNPIKIVKLKRHFTIYVGRLISTDTALSMKIRLAEEYGLNGKIVRIIRNSNTQYIYGE